MTLRFLEQIPSEPSRFATTYLRQILEQIPSEPSRFATTYLRQILEQIPSEPSRFATTYLRQIKKIDHFCRHELNLKWSIATGQMTDMSGSFPRRNAPTDWKCAFRP
jgi:hypothetical protein